MTGNYYAPTITLNGRALDTTARVEGVSVLSGLAIEWGVGENDWIAENPGSTLTMELIDPEGELLKFVGGPGGDRIEIHRAPDGVLWRGELQDAEAVLDEIQRVHDPSTTRRVWRVTLTASDPLATTAADRRHGPPPQANAPGPKNSTHWGPCGFNERVIDILNRSPADVTTEVHPAYLPGDIWIPGGSALAPIAGYVKTQNMSLLGVIHRTMRTTHLVARPYYYASEDRIQQTTPRPVDKYPVHGGEVPAVDLGPYHLTITGAGGVLDLTPTGSAGFKRISGGDLSTDRVRVVASPLTRITNVERVGRIEKIETDAKGGQKLEYEDYAQTASTGMKDREVTTASFEVDLSAAHWNVDSSWWHQREFWRKIFTRVGPGVIEYRLPVTATPAADADLELARPEPPSLAYRQVGMPIFRHHRHYKTCYLVGSLTNLIPNAGPFAIVGGQLVYDADRGWIHTIETAPMPEPDSITNAPALTLGQITTDATLGNANPSLMVADLARATAA